MHCRRSISPKHSPEIPRDESCSVVGKILLIVRLSDFLSNLPEHLVSVVLENTPLYGELMLLTFLALSWCRAGRRRDIHERHIGTLAVQ
jgi:hypothetical protein